MLLLNFLPQLSASELGVSKVFLPVYIKHGYINGDGEFIHSKPMPITFISRGAYPETTLAILKSSFVPHHDATWHEKPKDTNLISMCGVKLTYAYIPKQGEKNGNVLQIVLNMKGFKKPKTVNISNDEVKVLIKKAVTQNFPGANIKIQNGEQDGPDQPASDLEPKPDGKKKPKPESKERSQ